MENITGFSPTSFQPSSNIPFTQVSKSANVAQSVLSKSETPKESESFSNKTVALIKVPYSLGINPKIESMLAIKAQEFLQQNPVQSERDLDKMVISLRGENPHKILFIARELWQQRGNSILAPLAENNVLQTKVLQLMELSASKLSEQGMLQQAVLIRKEAADVSFSSSHPLNQPEKATGENSYIIDTKSFGKVNLGAYCSKLDTSLLKGSSLHAVKKEIKENDTVTSYLEFNFDLMPAYRKQIDEQIEIMKKNLDMYEKCGLPIQINSSHFEYLAVEEGYFLPPGHTKNVKQDLGSTIEITFKGIGKVTIGSDPTVWTNYNRMSIQMESGRSLNDIQTMLTQLGLAPLVGMSSEEDQEKIKIMYLFRAVIPREAFKLETDPAFYQQTVEEMKQQIITINSSMKGVFEEICPEMKTVELLPGKIRYTVPILVDIAKELGVLGFTHVIAGKTNAEKIECLVGMLKHGLIATQQRWDAGAFYKGQSSLADHKEGGADAVFTRLMTAAVLEAEEEEEGTVEASEEEGELSVTKEEKLSIESSDLLSKLEEIEDFFKKTESIDEDNRLETAQMTIDQIPVRNMVLQIKVKAVELNPYQYLYDNYGLRNPNQKKEGLEERVSYADRPSFSEFVQEAIDLETEEEEIMFKNRLSPDYFKGITVTPGLKQIIISRLHEENLLTMKQGVACYNDIPIDEFIMEDPSIEVYKSHLLKHG